MVPVYPSRQAAITAGASAAKAAAAAEPSHLSQDSSAGSSATFQGRQSLEAALDLAHDPDRPFICKPSKR